MAPRANWGAKDRMTTHDNASRREQALDKTKWKANHKTEKNIFHPYNRQKVNLF